MRTGAAGAGAEILKQSHRLAVGEVEGQAVLGECIRGDGDCCSGSPYELIGRGKDGHHEVVEVRDFVNGHRDIADGGPGFEEEREARFDSVNETCGRELVSVYVQNLDHDSRKNKIGEGGAGDSSIRDRDDA